MERKFTFSVGEFYHAYNRGNNKSNIFKDNKDRSRFVKLLYVCNSTKPVVFKTIQGLPLDEIDRGETLVDIGAYCLMSNHFHLLLKEKVENGISVFMGKLMTAYSMYFNKKYEKTGRLFENTFKAVHITRDEHLKYLFSYIHLNPIEIIEPGWRDVGIIDTEKTKNYLLTYVYSSYAEYFGIHRPEKIILQQDSFPEYFLNYRDFDQFINEWLTFPRTTLGNGNQNGF